MHLKKLLTTCAFIGIFFTLFSQTTISIFDEVLYYDGYDPTVYASALNDGILRHTNYLYATKLSEAQISAFGEEITMQVVVKASCDNYDRIGNVNLAFINKGDTTYNKDSVNRIEIGRFITPFMDMNKQPDTVPYSYTVDYLNNVFNNEDLLSTYDIWVELEIFGVPYAANEQIAGCAGRSDVCYGSLEFITNSETELDNNNVLIPLYCKQNFNNYQDEATNQIGQTILSKDFWLEEPLSDVSIVIITSNHGSNAGGEEYNRRNHYVYIDDNIELTYKPGRTSCEPFRVYNTQANGIYGISPRTDEEWQSFSNWCPGDVIDNRIIEFDTLAIGSHKFKIEVPDAVFNGAQGNIPLSAYIIGKKITPPSTGFNSRSSKSAIYPNPITDFITIKSDNKVKTIQLFSITGNLVKQTNNTKTMDIQNIPQGLYTTKITYYNGTVENHKIVKK